MQLLGFEVFEDFIEIQPSVERDNCLPHAGVYSLFEHQALLGKRNIRSRSGRVEVTTTHIGNGEGYKALRKKKIGVVVISSWKDVRIPYCDQ